VSENALLRVEGLSVSLRTRKGNRQIVQDVSLEVERGGMVAVVGESGAGKSLSVRAMLGLLDDRLFEVGGRIEVLGKDVGTLARRERRRYLTRATALVPQHPMQALNPTMKVGEQIAEALCHSRTREVRLSRKAAASRSLELMHAVGIADPEARYHSYPHELSGGMNQRIVIAVALSCDSAIMCCDEPTSALDVTTQAVIMDLIDDLRRSRELGVVFVTHDLPLAATRADEVVVIHGGSVVEQLPARHLAKHAVMPYTRALVQTAGYKAVAGLTGSAAAASERGCTYAASCPRADDHCRAVRPELIPLNDSHSYRCWHPVDAQAEAAAAERSESHVS
jgi:ABC-type dipeptide/oligopeptide/nickel transport system ATPase component